MRKPRQPRTPSSSNKLALLISKLEPCYRQTPGRIQDYLAGHRTDVVELAGPALTDWAIAQLSTPPHVTCGWPAPCPAARKRMRKAATR
jgi:hypothetical protein